jgi:peptidoglycan/LPS O-acetylase OafA/YrhL
MTRFEPELIGAHRRKLAGLEVVRFLSALAMLVRRCRHFYFVDRPVGLVDEKQPLHSAFGLFYDQGFYGVDVFWCISGFIFSWKYREAIADGVVTAKQFFVMRLSRHLASLHTRCASANAMSMHRPG